MYRGHTEIGEVWDGNVQCDHSGAFVKINARGTWIVANSPMGGQFGFARLVWVGRWAIYDTDPASVLVGLAVRPTPRRWDVFRRPSGRLFGLHARPRRVPGRDRAPDDLSASTPSAEGQGMPLRATRSM
jgi:hypothetical protein